MYVCLCADKAEQDIKDAIKRGFTTVEGLMEETGVGGGCGTCQMWIERMIKELIPSSQVYLFYSS